MLGHFNSNLLYSDRIKTWVQGSEIVFSSVFFLYLNVNLNGIQRQLLNILMRKYTYVDVHTLADKFRKLYHF